MNKAFSLAAVSLLLLASCNNSSRLFPDFEREKNGAYMKFYERNAEGETPSIGDGVTFEMAQYFNDSLLFTTAGEKPITIELEPAGFVGDVADAIMMMHVGDSARLAVLSDSVFVTMMQIEVPEEYKGKPIYYDIKLLSIKPKEEIAAERKALIDSLRIVENDYLASMQADPKSIVTESGLIILEKTGKGKVAQMGDYVDFDFVMCNMEGDTLMNSFDVEPVEMQYGEEFISKGFTEALGLVPSGGVMRFVIPSKLAFDSTGYQGLIKPCTPLVVRLRMNEVLDKDAYEKKQARIEAEQEAERERLLQQEARLIERYVKDNGIEVKPSETGVYIVYQEKGEGNVAQWGDRVTVHYTLHNLKGDYVESSYDYGEPMTFTIGQGEMIPAIEEAVMTMAPGAKVMLVSPSSQAFGEFEVDMEKLPPYSPVMFELELVAVE